MRQRRDLGAYIAVAAVAAVTVLVVRREPDWSLAGADPAAVAVQVLAAFALVAAGIVLRRGPESRSGTLLIAAAAAWLIAEWNNPGAPGAAVFTAGLVLGEACAAVVAHALLVHGHGQLRGRAQLAVAGAAYAGLLVIGGLGATLASDPGAHGCAGCPGNLLRLADGPTIAADLQRWGLLLGIVALALASALLAHSLWRASTARRRSAAPVVLGGLVYLAVVVARYVHGWPAWPGNDSTERALRLVEASALLGIAAGVAWQRVAARRMRRRLSRIVMQLARAPRPGELRSLLADALDDATLELFHATDQGWIDTTGASRSPPAIEGRAVTSLAQDDVVVAAIGHRPGLLDDPRLVQELARTAALALRHDRLQAQLRAQLEQLRQSRISAVMAADAERRQLERDLHDGAQQALAALALTLAVETGIAPAMGASGMALGRAHAQIRSALEAVRTIAHGVYPAVLSDAGLAPALDVLTEWSPNLECEPVAQGRFDPAVESTAYFIVAALARATTAPVTASIAHHNGRLYVDVATADVPELGELEDRVGAVDGRVHVRLGSGSERLLRAELPCA
jgi:signal transduction histidine kinase